MLVVAFAWYQYDKWETRRQERKTLEILDAVPKDEGEAIRYLGETVGASSGSTYAILRLRLSHWNYWALECSGKRIETVYEESSRLIREFVAETMSGDCDCPPRELVLFAAPDKPGAPLLPHDELRVYDVTSRFPNAALEPALATWIRAGRDGLETPGLIAGPHAWSDAQAEELFRRVSAACDEGKKRRRYRVWLGFVPAQPSQDVETTSTSSGTFLERVSTLDSNEQIQFYEALAWELADDPPTSELAARCAHELRFASVARSASALEDALADDSGAAVERSLTLAAHRTR